ncbi:MAG: DUF3426 domain-containing protein [Betaproteobacteria bacterium]
MADELFTRCPGCKTVFRVTDAQLALRDGQVRCGHCRTVFNGPEHLISLAPVTPSDDDAPHDELSSGPPTVTLRSARALDPPPPEDTPPATAATAVDYENRFAWETKKAPSRARTILGIIGIPILVLALFAQAVHHFRDSLAANSPALKPLLVRTCALVGCTIQPLRSVSALSIEASDLQADPAHRGLLVLTATIRNRAPYTVGFPYLELSLTDAQDQAVVRRALAPADYVSGTANTAAGIPGNSEVPVKLFIDASATTQAGYRLYLFFP